MGNKVAAIIPSRNEPYLIQTVDNALQQARGEVEVVVIIEDFGQTTKDGKPITPTAEAWNEVQQRHSSRLTTILHHEARGMRPAINAGAASAISRGAKYLAKFDAHCAFGEGWDTILAADCDDDWVVVPRRLRLDVDTFAPRDDGRPPIDYHYLSFPDNVNDFGGPGLNGKVWAERQRERARIELDDEMSSQGSGWFMTAANFQRLELMDDTNYGPFWNEFQEIGLKGWLSGGQVKVNKRTWYAHWHKGSAGRGYRMPEAWLRQGASFSKRWMFNEAWAKQQRPFKWLIEHFWPVPTWPENWEELVYSGANRSKVFLTSEREEADDSGERLPADTASLRIISAHYGPPNPAFPNLLGEKPIDVTDILRRKVVGDSLDINVCNAELEVGNPWRGIKKRLVVVYAYNGSEPVTLVKDERDWLIIGQSARYVKGAVSPATQSVLDSAIGEGFDIRKEMETALKAAVQSPMSATALNDFLIRKFNVPAHRLRGPMPIEIPTFHRNDLAQLFAELGFTKGAEVGVAEGNYSEVLLKANPKCHLLLVDPWHAYSGNPQNKSKEKNEYAYNETLRKTKGYNVTLDMRYSMDAVRDVPDGSLDFVYIDGHHSYPFVMPDTCIWATKVRSGGIVALDDIYALQEKWGAGPMEAVYDYTRAMKINPWFLINAHKSVDAFWVKP